jgi:hypothetical protein
MKNTLDLNLTPLHLEQVVYHWAIKAILYTVYSSQGRYKSGDTANNFEFMYS